MSDVRSAVEHVTYTGTLNEIGMLEEGMGVKLMIEGQPLVLVGMSLEDVRALAPHWGKPITITVSCER